MKLKPSDFVRLGKPSCSCFSKSELERLAFDYVRALVIAGDNWDIRLSPKEVVDILEDKCDSYIRLLGRGKTDPVKWDCVTSKLKSEEGAKEVWSFCLRKFEVSQEESGHPDFSDQDMPLG